jgi:hypothetical protein
MLTRITDCVAFDNSKKGKTPVINTPPSLYALCFKLGKQFGSPMEMRGRGWLRRRKIKNNRNIIELSRNA